MSWIAKILGLKKRRKPRGPNLDPSELTAEERAYRAKRAAAARARRRREKSG